MRNAFIDALTIEARRDPALWLLCGDIGFSVLEKFAAEFPDRFLNVGVAEQNMIGIAAGLALTGKRVFTYTIGNFSFMRCLEQIRNDVCYHKLNVTVVAVGGGFAYGAMGYTHHAVEDIAMLRTLPGMTVVAPGDPLEALAATKLLAAHNGPAYLRLGRGGEKKVHAAAPAFALGKAIVMKEGKKATIVTSAATLDIAAEAAEKLGDVGLISMPTLAPFDAAALLAIKTPHILTVEEHGVGGLGTLAAETLMGKNVKLTRLYAHLPPAPEAGDRQALRERNGLTVENIIASITEAT